jgi:2-oxoglutarate ferredoxin oxidoreductase subunit beta
MRRNINHLHIIEDNGCRPRRRASSRRRRISEQAGVVNDLPPSTPALASSRRATLWRSFSGRSSCCGSKTALAHRGTVMLDVISPCVTFNDHEGSTKATPT